MVRGDRFIVGIRFKGFHSIKISKFNEQNKTLITYPSLDYLELPYHLIESALLNHTSYESFELCVPVKGICFGLDCRRKIYIMECLLENVDMHVMLVEIHGLFMVSYYSYVIMEILVLINHHK